MAKDVERKRKLEQEQIDYATAKRLKQSQKSSVKANGGSSMAALERNETNPSKLSAEQQSAAQDELESIPFVGKSKKRKSSQNNETSGSAGKTIIGHVPVIDAPAESKKSKKEKEKKKKRQELVKMETNDAEAAADHRSESGTVISTKDKSQRAREKKARRKAEREIKAGLKDDDELTAPNENGWWLSQPSAGRYLDHDPIFVADENGDDCLIAATVREVQLLHIDNSLIARTHAVPDGRSILAYTRSAEYPDHVVIAYDNGAKVQWNWTTGSVIHGSFPGHETTIATTTASLPDGTPEVYYIAQTQGTYTIVGGRKAWYTTYRRLSSIKVLQGGAYIICLGTTAMVLGKRKDGASTADYIWIEMPTVVPFQCLDARLVVPPSAKGSSSAKQQKAVTPDLALAVGNAGGQIHLYTGLSSLFVTPSQATLPSPRILHWHREAVSAVKFSRDGNYLISGGRESVLVIWQLETGHKQFLPHLTAEIERIVVSPKGTQYALQMGDNSIMVLSTTELKPIANFAGLQLPVMSEQLQLQDMVTPATTAMLHPGKPQHLLLTVPATQPKYASDITTRPFLQSFDIQNARHIGRQALSRNNVTDFNRGPENTPIIPPDVNLLSASADGRWLVTVDEWFPPASDLEHAVSRTSNLDNVDLANIQEEQLKRREVYLKFWRWDESQAMWTLSTRADAPHARTSNADLGTGAGRILQLKSDPASDGFATVGEDGEVRIWKPKTKIRNGVPLKEPNGDYLVEWTCRRTIKLPLATDLDVRADSPMDEVAEQDKPLAAVDACLAYSADGSILACTTISADLTAQPLVHFIDPAAGIITSTKSGIIPADEDVQDFGFLDRYFIVLSLGQVRVWNLVDDSVHYTITIPGQPEEQDHAKLAIHALDETFAITSTLGISMENDAPVPQIAVYAPALPEALFEAELESTPVALLTAKHTRGYTILFEDGTIRTLTSAQSSSAHGRRYSLAATETSETAEADPVITGDETEIASSSALALLSAKAEDEEMADTLAPLLLVGEGEDDRPVVRPEQLTSIFDVGQGVALPPVRDMFRDVVGLFARKPRVRVVDAMEL